MNCYFCGGTAAGQCTGGCGRFVCRTHATMVKNKLHCVECGTGGQDSLVANLKRQLQQPHALQSCAICSTPVIVDPTLAEHIFSFEHDAQIFTRLQQAQKFARKGDNQAGCNCVTCTEHSPKWVYLDTDPGSQSYYECRVCRRRGGDNYSGSGSAGIDNFLELFQGILSLVSAAIGVAWGGNTLSNDIVGYVIGGFAGLCVGAIAGIIIRYILVSATRTY